MFKGIDISVHNGIIDFEKVKKEIDFVMIRAGYWRTVDSMFHQNIQECTRLNIPVGVYWFCYALTVEDAKKEAYKLLEVIKPYNITYPIAYDLEYDTMRYAKTKKVKIDKKLASEMVVAFCDIIEDAGYYVMNYANKEYQKKYFDDSTGKYDLWYARWNVKEPDATCGIWQYSSNGHVNGVKGRVDMNISYKDYYVLIKKLGLNKQSSDTLDSKLKELELDNQQLSNENKELKTKLSNIKKILEV